jgi:hypothetical protein
MYFSKQKTLQTNVGRTNKAECPYLKYDGKCVQCNCAYAHDSLELAIWDFVNDNQINMQLP